MSWLEGTDGRHPGDDADLAGLETRYERATDAQDATEMVRLLHQIVEHQPGTAWAWFDLGLQAKWRHDWQEAVECNRRSLAIATEDEGDPAAWNLGIAATALGDWATARTAWARYGIRLRPGSGPVLDGFGPTPVRLNAQPSYPGQLPVSIQGSTYQPEVVWTSRLCPARAVVQNVPTPESGHRFGDVVLHDGVPNGERSWSGTTYSVFDELILLERSGLPTWQVEVVGALGSSVERLSTLASARDGLAEDWSESVRVLCTACSEGSPDDHEHSHPGPGPVRSVGLAARESDVSDLLESWRAECSGVEVLSVRREG